MIVKQVIYYSDNKGKNLNTISYSDLTHNIEFSNLICDEVKIKTIPGTKITLNNESITIGVTGIYEILYDEKVKILSLSVDEKSANIIKNLTDGYFVATFMVKN